MRNLPAAAKKNGADIGNIDPGYIRRRHRIVFHDVHALVEVRVDAEAIGGVRAHAGPDDV